ncbi:MAG: antibiotic biosynthesis monooxygenase [Actinomycetota bacterium]|nr:antibiotic biosynthesis monooxygenase [Actinomycetota bacterium]
MPVLVTTTVPLDIGVYDQIVAQLGPGLLAAPGFRSHAGRAGDTGTFVVTEVWNSREEYQGFFDAHVAANLPPGVTTDISELRNFLAA